jgi:hypothetical protein
VGSECIAAGRREKRNVHTKINREGSVARVVCLLASVWTTVEDLIRTVSAVSKGAVGDMVVVVFANGMVVV